MQTIAANIFPKLTPWRQNNYMNKEKADAFARAMDRSIADKKTKNRRYSVKQAAKDAGIPYYTMANYRRGQTIIPEAVILNISRILPNFEAYYKSEMDKISGSRPEGAQEDDPQKAMFEMLLKELREIREKLIEENIGLKDKYIRELERKLDKLRNT